MGAVARGLLLALVVLAGCAVGDPGAGAGPDVVELLPAAAELSGWSMADRPAVFSPDTLYEVLNGGADRYLTHGFRRLARARYQLGDDPLACVRLDVFDMGTELGAFGIYSAGRPAGVEPRPWGAEGYRNGTIAAAYRGGVFVHGEADDDRPELLAGLETLLSRVAAQTEGPTTPPAVLDPLPVTGRISGSERYVPTDLLGHSFLPGGVIASYEVEGGRVEVFVSDLGSEAEAKRALSALRAHHARRASISELSPPLGDDGFRSADPTLGADTVARVGGTLVGAHDRAENGAGDAVLRELVANLTGR